jgi:ribosome biogenesis GTPase
MLEGTIIKGIGGFYYIVTKIGVYECHARGKFRNEHITPTVGDYVEISVIDDGNKKGSLDVILPRKNKLIRPKVANVDQVIIVFAAVSPEFNAGLLDRFLILAQQQKLEITLIINKIDLDKEKKYEKYINIYQGAGFKVLPISANLGINTEKAAECVKNKISVLAGPSGVGKSSFINSLNKKLNIKTGELSKKIKRGKNTTRHAELMEIFPNSYIVDSPGFTSLYINNVKPEELQDYYPEFAPYTCKCRFTGCMHISEPDCMVKENVGYAISKERYESYKDLYEELSEQR